MGTTNTLDLNNRVSTLEKAITENAEDIHDGEKGIYAVMGQMGAKNLISYPPYKSTTRSENGVTFTDIGDGTIKVETDINGATANTYFILLGSPNYYLLKKGTYILSDGTGRDDSIALQIFDSTPQHTTIVTTEYGDTQFIVGADVAVAIRLNIKSGCITTGTLVKPMLRLASDTDDTYQPYARTNKELTDGLNAVKAQIPDAPSADGTYNLSVTVANGASEYSWVSTS